MLYSAFTTRAFTTRAFRTRRGLVLPLATLAVVLCTSAVSVEASGPVPTASSSGFNGTDIAAGDWIWFNSVIKASGYLPGPTTINFQNVTISFSHDGVDYVIDVPDAAVTFSPTATLATTTYDAGTDTWITEIPTSINKNEWLTGIPFQVPVDFEGGIGPVTWSGDIGKSSDDDDVSMCWKWGAAVYTDFTSDLNAIGVKPTDDNSTSIYLNSHHAGSAENYTDFVIGGARGGGGSNYTGSYSGTECVPDIPLPVSPSTWGWVKTQYR